MINLKRIEASDGSAAGLTNNVADVRAALEAAGIEFISENGSGGGMRPKKPKEKREKSE